MINAESLTSKPEDLGIDPEKLEAVFARAKHDVDQGILPSAQVAVARHGKLAGMRTFGSAVQGGTEQAATDHTMYHIFSSTKAVVAAAIWLLFDEGLLRLDEKVADIVPEFGTNGKEAIDVETMMLHAGGFPYAPFAQSKWGDRDALLQAMSQWRLKRPSSASASPSLRPWANCTSAARASSSTGSPTSSTSVSTSHRLAVTARSRRSW
jgi:CubicO group peptidase (beta-lactamase class C family)